jgi:hypothetical protein
LRPKKPGPAPSGLPPAPTPTAAEKAEQKRLQETQQRRAREAEQAAREAAQGRGGGRPLTPEGLREAPPPRPAEPRPQQERRQPPRALPRQMERVEQETPLDQFTRDIIAGTMFEVRRSSNVHSIGFVIEAPGQTKGDLFIRFLGTSADGKKRQGPGPVYQYTGVPLDLFREFLVAASAGKFVWDYIRVRGTVSGHRFPYELVGIVGDYVPRQAALRRGQAGEWYLKRIFTDTRYNTKTGKLERVKLTSQLPEQRVSMRGPNPDRGPGIDALRFGR